MTAHDPTTAAWLLSLRNRRCGGCGRPYTYGQPCRLGDTCWPEARTDDRQLPDDSGRPENANQGAPS